MRSFYQTLCFLLVSSMSAFGTTYYLSPAGAALNNVNNWWTVSGGTGSHPANFTSASDVWDLDNNNGNVPSSNTWTVPGTITCSNGTAVITINSSAQISLGGNFTNVANIAVVGTGTLTLTSSAQNIPICSVGILQIAGTGTAYAEANLNVNTLVFSGTNQLDMRTHSLTVGLVTGGGTHAIYTQNTGATPISAITYPADVLVDFNAGTTQTIPANTAFDGSLTISSSTITALSNISVDGTLTLSGDAILDMDTYQVTGSGTISGMGTSTFLTGNTSTAPYPDNCSFYNLQFDGASDQSIPAGTTVSNTIGFTANQTVTALGNLSVGGSLGFLGNASLDMDTYQLTGAISTVSFSGTHTFRTAYTGAGLPFPADLNFTLSSFTVEFYAAGDQTIPGGTSGASTIYNLSLTGSGVKTLDNNHQLTIGSSGGTLNIEPGVGFASTSGTTVTFNGSTITMNADALEQGHMKLEGTVSTSNSPSFVREIYLSASTPKYYNISTGVSGSSLNTLPESGATIVANSGSTGSVWYWNSVNSKWTAPANITDAVDPTVGYTIYAGTANGTDFLRSTDGTIAAEGTGIVTTDQSITLNYHDGTNGDDLFSGGATGYGWNLVANPFTATYDWTGQALPSNTNNIIYIWGGTTYSAWNGSVGVAGGSELIPPAQAFWIQTTATPDADLTLSYSQTDASQSTPVLKSNPEYIKLNLWDDNGEMTDEIAIQFDPSATAGYDRNMDAHKLPSTLGHPYAFVALANKQMSICAASTSTTDFPVHLKPNNGSGVYTFTLQGNQLSSFTDAILEDKTNGQYTQLMRGGSYSFTVNQNDPEDRFVLHFNNNSVGLDDYSNTPLTVGLSGNQLILFNQNAIEGSRVAGDILDLHGRLITQFDVETHSDRNVIPLPSLSAGVYMVRMTLNHETWTERIVVY
ncbi:T9SS type A sorting domain-containing protein [Phaeocystidibacter marisrubri]|uniref:T9SS type A sorting domain-containing protein n=1 Tax=Phaeocystidibacter marisrubri TaxID=1577780 RepID=A0A6L3ZEG1_9FLAO|nr:T9SS type A sorting domain-containing protein [Phaeocystidibacter marisrubri]KAB2815834.1 T9SS type A sorting domain-containing protein [Phaeocystidibacter marisrubri]